MDAGRDSAPGRAPSLRAARPLPPSPPVTRRRRLGSCLRAPGKRHCEGPHARAPSLPTPPSAAAAGGRGGRPGSCAVTPNQRLGHRCQAARSSGGAHRAAGTWPAPRRSPLPAPWKATHSCGLGHRTLAARGVPSTLFPSGTQRLQRHKLQAPATCSGPAAPGPTPGPSGPRATDAEQSPRSRGHAPPGGWGQGRSMWSEATCHVPASAGKSRRPARSPQGAPGPRTAPRRGRRFRRQPSGRDSQVHG